VTDWISSILRPRKMLKTNPPTISYPGGKARMAKTLVSFMPTAKRYVEPFVGRGNVFWAVATLGPSFQNWWLNDVATIPFFEAMKTAALGLAEVPDRSKKEYYKQWEAFKRGDEIAILLEPYLTFGGGGYGTGGPGGKKGATAGGYLATLHKCSEVLHKTLPRLTSWDYLEVLEQCGEDDFVYLDPPYKGADVRSYKENAIHHEDMVKVLRNAKFKWLLSEFSHELYIKELGDPFFQKDVQLVGTNYTFTNAGKERRTECVWRNY
jgi:DNA adenine methylase